MARAELTPRRRNLSLARADSKSLLQIGIEQSLARHGEETEGVCPAGHCRSWWPASMAFEVKLKEIRGCN
jgi:hypothetical protein